MRLLILVLVLALGGLVAVPFLSAQQGGVIPGGSYSGTFQDTTGLCDEGDLRLGESFSFRISGDGRSITEVGVTDLYLGGQQLDSTAVPITIPIDPDGSFDHDTSVGGVGVHVEGQFQGDAVSGFLRATLNGVVECEATFTATGSPPPPPSPLQLSGSVEETGAGCGGGALTLTVSADRRSITGAGVQEVAVNGGVVSGSATFAEGTVPIAANGSFGWAYFSAAGPALEIAVNGTFTVGSARGLLTIEPSGCGPMSFFVSAGGGQGGPDALPSTGAGPSSPSAWPLLRVALALTTLSAAALVAAIAIRHKNLA